MSNKGWMQIALNRFPWKQGWDALAVGQMLLRGNVAEGRSLSPQQKRACLKFYFDAANIDRLQVMPPRSGSHWSELGMTLAIDRARGGDGAYTYEKRLFWPRNGLSFQRLDWRIPSGQNRADLVRDGGPALGELLYLHSRNPYYRVRSAALKRMRIVVLTRSIVDCLESGAFKHTVRGLGRDGRAPQEATFDWQRALDHYIAFFNSWGDVMRWHPRILHYRYEDAVADPVAVHKKVLDFWGFDVPESCIAESFASVTKAQMRRRMPAEEQAGSIRIDADHGAGDSLFSPDEQAVIRRRLQQDLIHDFGYRF